jgi:hypothetical protein
MANDDEMRCAVQMSAFVLDSLAASFLSRHLKFQILPFSRNSKIRCLFRTNSNSVGQRADHTTTNPAIPRYLS